MREDLTARHYGEEASFSGTAAARTAEVPRRLFAAV
jgi:hypothetical protein